MKPSKFLAAAALALAWATRIQAASVIQFSAASFNATEGMDQVEIVVQRTNDLETVVGVHFATADLTATSAFDYTAVAVDLTFESGETNKTVAVPILNDGVVEPVETFQVTLRSPSGGAVLGSRADATVRITDNDFELQVEFATYSVAENGDAVRTAVIRGDDGDYAVTVDYGTTDGSAIAGTDYTATAGTLRFEAGEKIKVLQVSILKNSRKQSSRSFRLSLANPTGGAVLASQKTATVTILDDDPGVQFEFRQYWVHETAVALAVGVLRGSDVDLPAFTVDYSSTNFTATAGEDYTESKGTLAFEAGETMKVMSVPVLFREQATPDTQLRLTLSNPSAGVILGTNRVATITILDMSGMVPHRLDAIAVLPNRNVELTFAGSVHKRFAPYFDLYPLEVSTDLINWVPLATLQRENSSTNDLTYLDSGPETIGARFYRTPEANFISPFLRPTGPKAVGVVSLLVTDPTRTNRYGIPTNSSFMVNVWYPALPAVGRPNLFLDREFALDPAWGGVFVPQAPYFHTYARRGAAPLRGPMPYPVLLYSHGGAGDRNTHADLAEELASHGYIVVFPDHANAWRSVFPDGRVISTANMPWETRISIVMLNEGITDMRFLLDELKRWNAENGWLAGMVDVNNVGVAGMSMGAYLPMELCRSDSRCRAAVLLELGSGLGAAFERLAQQEVRSPLLMLNASYNGSTLYFDRASKDATWVQIGNTEHDMFSSYYWWVRPGDVPGGLETARTIRGYTLWFLNKYLQGSTDPTPVRTDYPRVINTKQK